MLKKYAGLLAKSIGIILASAAVGFLLLMAVYALPSTTTRQHIVQSMDTIMTERDYPSPHKWSGLWRDNYTDFLMINHAAYAGDESLIQKAVNAYRTSAVYQGEKVSLPSSTLLAISYDPEVAAENGIKYGQKEYSRYWHGYLLYLKPLLCIFTYDQLRVFNAVLQSLLLALALFLLYRRNAKGLIIPFLLVWGLLIPADTAASLQYTDIYLIFVIGSIILLWRMEWFRNSNGLYYLFLAMGIATSYFDLLTYPLLTYGIPMGIILYVNNSGSVKKDILRMAEFAVLWVIGYWGMWACKWALVSLFTDGDIRSIVSAKITDWTSSTSDLGESITWFDTVKRLFGVLIPNPAFLPAVLYAAFLIVFSAVKKRFDKRGLIMFGILAVAPLAWLAVISSHSYSHYWFTHKELILFIYAILLMFTPAYPGKKPNPAERIKRRKRHFPGRRRAAENKVRGSERKLLDKRVMLC